MSQISHDLELDDALMTVRVPTGYILLWYNWSAQSAPPLNAPARVVPPLGAGYID